VPRSAIWAKAGCLLPLDAEKIELVDRVTLRLQPIGRQLRYLLSIALRNHSFKPSLIDEVVKFAFGSLIVDNHLGAIPVDLNAPGGL